MAESHREEIAKLEALYASNPGGRVFVHLAEAYRKAGELELARGILSDGLARHTDSASGYVVLGRVLSDMGDSPEAERAFRRVLELDAGNLIALRGLGDLALEEGRTGDALDLYRELLSRNPSNEEVRTLVGDVERRAADEAAGAYEHAEPAAAPDAAAQPPEVHESAAAPEPSPAGFEPLGEAIAPFSAAPGATGDAAAAEPVFLEAGDTAESDPARDSPPDGDEGTRAGAWDTEPPWHAEAGPGEAVREHAFGQADAHEHDERDERDDTDSRDAGDAGQESRGIAGQGADVEGGYPADAVTPGADDRELDLEGLLQSAASDGAVDVAATRNVDAPEVETFDSGEGLLDLDALEPAEGLETSGPAEEFDGALDLTGDLLEGGGFEEATGDAAVADDLDVGLSLVDTSREPAADDDDPPEELPEWSSEAFPPLSLAEGPLEPSEEDWHIPSHAPGGGLSADADEEDETGAGFSFLESDEEFVGMGAEADDGVAWTEAYGAQDAGRDDMEETDAAAGSDDPAESDASPFVFADEPSRMGEVVAGAAELDLQAAAGESAAADSPAADRAEPQERGLETETMADLYRAQGFHDRAADVYRALLRRRPDDERLTARLRELEEEMAAPRRSVASPEDEAGEGDAWLRGAGTAWAGEAAAGSDASPYVWAEPALAESEDQGESGEPIGSYLAALASWSPAGAAGGEGPESADAAVASLEDAPGEAWSDASDPAAPLDDASANEAWLEGVSLEEAPPEEPPLDEAPWLDLESVQDGSTAGTGGGEAAGYDEEPLSAQAGGADEPLAEAGPDSPDDVAAAEGGDSEPWAMGDVDYGYEPWAETSAGDAADSGDRAEQPQAEEPVETSAPAPESGGSGAAGGRRDVVEAAFDEWYGGTEEPKPTAPPAEEESEDDEDLAMFRSWLQSLKK